MTFYNGFDEVQAGRAVSLVVPIEDVRVGDVWHNLNGEKVIVSVVPNEDGSISVDMDGGILTGKPGSTVLSYTLWTKYAPGDKVIANGYEGTVTGEYLPDMYEVRLSAGDVVIPACELTPVGR